MVKKNFELFLQNQYTVGVVVKTPYLFYKLQKRYKHYPEGTKWSDGDEPLFWVPLTDQRRLLADLSVSDPDSFDLKEVLS